NPAPQATRAPVSRARVSTAKLGFQGLLRRCSRYVRRRFATSANPPRQQYWPRRPRSPTQGRLISCRTQEVTPRTLREGSILRLAARRNLRRFYQIASPAARVAKEKKSTMVRTRGRSPWVCATTLQ